MASTIQEFLSSFTTDLARPNKFDVLIPLPQNVWDIRTSPQQLALRCENAELPSRTMGTV